MVKTQKNQINNKFICPECDSQLIPPKELKAGIITECKVCGIESEIISVNPIQLSPLEEEK